MSKLNQISPFVLPDLPYAQNALEPYISANTLSFHHGKHHNTYVTNLNNLVPNTKFASMNLEQIIKESHGDKEAVAIFNNAAQVWNHTFFWHSMKQNGGGKPTGKILSQIEKDFGDYGSFATALKNAGVTQFGSGWAWLTWDGSKLLISKTGNADLPLTQSQKPILTIDVWEHAYYLDYQNRRVDYLTIMLEHLINWDFALSNFEDSQ